MVWHFLKAAFHKIYLVHSRLLYLIFAKSSITDVWQSSEYTFSISQNLN